MLGYNLLLLILPLMASGEPVSQSVPPTEEPVVPRLSDAQRIFLSRVARRTLRDAALGRKIYQPGYVPAELESVSIEVVVRLREGGYLRAAGASGPTPIVSATRDAALAAYGMLRGDSDVSAGDISRLLIEIEAVGAALPIPIQADWTQPRAVAPYIEPGVHGVVLHGPRGSRRFCPTELFTSGMLLADALKGLAQQMHSDSSQVADTRLMRFRTVHWYEPESGAPVVLLHRGLVLVPPEAVSPRGLDESIAALADYMTYRQLPDGLFSYEYKPALDVYSDQDNIVRQAGATLAMSYYAAYARTSASLAAAEQAIRRHLEGLVDIPAADPTAFIATPDRQNKLGVTALLTVAMAVHPDPARFGAIREKLVNGMLWLQRPSGMFVTSFPPAERIDAQDYFPGEALLGLAAQYDHQPSAAILGAFDRAIGFYRVFFHGAPSPAFVPWQVQAYTLMAKHTKRKDYIDFVFELTDWLAEMQLNESDCPWPEMQGGIAPYQPGRAGVATAAYLEGFADALWLARSVGDRERAERYEKVVRSAARFVMQLQVRPEEAYFIRSPQDAVGGIRTSLALNLLRIDHCQHALVGLIKARQVLFPDTD